jgi:hypothetical protein
MLDRLKFWRKNIEKATSDASLTSQEPLGDGKAEFLGEGSAEEFKQQEEGDKGLRGVFGL